MGARRFERKQEYSIDCAPLCNEELKFVLKWMGTTQSMRCRDHTNMGHISAGTVFWTYADWEFFAHFSEYYTTLNFLPLFNTS
jgi:hypothetical protein